MHDTRHMVGEEHMTPLLPTLSMAAVFPPPHTHTHTLAAATALTSPLSSLLCLSQGAVADLSTVLTLQPNNAKGQEELQALKSRAQAVAAAAAAQAEYQRHTSRTVADSCTIEEVEDDPEEEQAVGV
jgi:hypothetical protein